MRHAVVLSVGVHAGLVAGVAAWRSTAGAAESPPEAPPAVTIAVETAPPPSPAEPVEVAFVVVPDAPVPVLPAPRSPRLSNRGPRTAAATELAPSTAGTAATDVTGPTSEPEGASPSPDATLEMRGRRHDLRLPEAAIARATAPTSEAPYVPATDDRLRPRGHEHVVLDRVTKMTVAPDGTVKFHDKRDFTAHVIIPLSMSRDDWEVVHEQAKDAFKKWADDPYAAQRTVNYDEVAGACEAGACDTSGSSDEGGGLIGGKADITAALHRKFIGDPFAARKLKLLDSTREARAEIGARYRGEQLTRSAIQAQQNLQSLWQSITDAAARRAALFAMWDECEEGEGQLGEAGERVRVMVLGFIRSKLPVGSPGAFSEREIMALNARRTSRQPFAPY